MFPLRAGSRFFKAGVKILPKKNSQSQDILHKKQFYTCQKNFKIRQQNKRSTVQILRRYVSQTENNRTISNYFKLKELNLFTPTKLLWGVSGIITLIATVKWGMKGLLVLLIPITLVNRRDLFLTYQTIGRDIAYASRLIQASFEMESIRFKNWTVYDCFLDVVKKQPYSVMIYAEDTQWTYKDIDDKVVMYARRLNDLDVERGDVIGILVSNRAEYIAIVLALSKMGSIGALINTSLRHPQIEYCIKAARCKGLIFSQEFSPKVEELPSDLGNNFLLLQLDGEPKSEKYLEMEYNENNYSLTPEKYKHLPFKTDSSYPLLYIFTTGVKGLPKAAVLPNSKFISGVIKETKMLDLNEYDTIYGVLPLYSTAGLMLGAGPSMIKGIPVAIAKNFNPATYFHDCKKYRCTAAQYIGEICTFLLLQSPRQDVKHNVRLMFGNGLNPDVWRQFKERFGVEIYEFYGSTESNLHLVNRNGKDGAVGFIPKFIPKMFHPFAIIKVDEFTHEPIRDADGLCKRCEYNEPGMLVSFLMSTPEKIYHGLADDGKKTDRIILDVLWHGDVAFVSGDIVVMDKHNYIYFKRKHGESYRWKGHNISVDEVENIIATFIGKFKFTVYGVEIPVSTGQPGMIAIEDPDEKLDVSAFTEGARRYLPFYQRPMFIRLVKKLKRDANFPVVKQRLISDGFDPDNTYDKMYFYNKETSKFEIITEEAHTLILQGKLIL